MAISNLKNNTGHNLIKATYIGKNRKLGFKVGEEYILKLYNNSNILNPILSGYSIFVANSISDLLNNWEKITIIGKLDKDGKTKN